DRLAASPDPNVRRMTTPLIRAIDRAINLCTQTLTFGRTEEPPPVPQRFLLHDLVEDTALALGVDAADGLGWRNAVAPDFEIEADREQMFRVLLNLARNAVQAMDGSGELRIAAQRRDGRVLIDVADTGPGLPEKAREHLFEPFHG